MLKVGRNEEYIKFSADHAVTVNKVSQRLTMWPKILRPYDIVTIYMTLDLWHTGIWVVLVERPGDIISLLQLLKSVRG